MAKKKREKVPHIPDPNNRTSLSLNLVPGEAVTVDGPAAIVLKEIDLGESRLAIIAAPETTIVLVPDASIITGRKGPTEDE